MKINLTSINAYLNKELPCATASLRIIVDTSEMVTAVLKPRGKELVFPDEYEFGLEELVFASGNMPVEVDLFDMDHDTARAIGHGQDNLVKLTQIFNGHFVFCVELYNGPKHVGTVTMRAIITELETTFPLLLSQQQEIAHLKQVYETLADSSRILEQESQESVLVAQQQIEKLTKKHNDLVIRYNDLLNLYEAKEGEADEIRLVLQQTDDRLTEAAMQFEKEHELVEHLEQDLQEMVANCERERDVCEQQRALNEEQAAVIAQLEAQIGRLTDEAHNHKINVASNYVPDEPMIINNETVENIINNITNNITVINITPAQTEALRARNGQLLQRLAQATGALQLFVRTRAPNEDETKHRLIVDRTTALGADVSFFDPETKEWSLYDVDHHLAYCSDQEEVFHDVQHIVAGIVPSVDEVVNQVRNSSPGVNKHGAILAYGGEGTGKTFTMRGGMEHIGVYYRSVFSLFELLNLQKKNLEAKRASNSAQNIDDLVYEYQVKMSLLEVYEDKVFDLTSDAVERTNLATLVKWVSDGQLEINGLTCHEVGNVVEGIELLVNALHLLSERADFKGREATTSILVRAEVSVTTSADHVTAASKTAPLRSTLWLGELSAVGGNDPNLTGFNAVLEAMATKKEVIPYDEVPLTQLVKECFASEARTALLFTLAPSEVTSTVTKVTLQHLKLARSISRGVDNGPSVSDLQLQLQVKTMSNDLDKLNDNKSKLEDTILLMKNAAGDVMKRFNERNEINMKRYLDEKELCKQLYLDLQLTNSNLKRSLQDLKDQRTANLRLREIVKALEKERETLHLKPAVPVVVPSRD